MNSDNPLIEVHRPSNHRALILGLSLLALFLVVAVIEYRRNSEAVPRYFEYLGACFGGFTGALIGVGIGPLIQKRLLTYDSRERTIRARDRWWGRWRTYPRDDHGHLVYDAGTGRFYEVRANGKRRRVPVNRGDASREEWLNFVARFEYDHGSGGPEVG